MRSRSGLAPRLSGLASKPERRTKPLVGGIWVPENVSGFVQGPLYPGVPHKGLCTSAAPRVRRGLTDRHTGQPLLWASPERAESVAKEARSGERLPGKCGSEGHILKGT